MKDGIGPHEGIELDLMLQGKKKIALFELLPDQFNDYINSGLFQQVVVDRYTIIVHANGSERGADELCSLLIRSRKLGFVEELERRIGELLGYRSSDIDIYIEHSKRNFGDKFRG